MPSVRLIGESLALGCTYEDRELAKEIGDGKWERNLKVWTYPCMSDKLSRIKRLFPDVVVDAKVDKKISEIEAIQEHALHLKTLDDIKLELPSLKSTLYKHQKVGVAFMLHQDRCMNFDEMGVGKTLQAIVTAILRKQRGEINRCLVVCPASVKHVWKKEIEKHSHEKSLIVEGNKIKRQKIYDEFSKGDYLFLIMNYELVRIDFKILTILADQRGGRENSQFSS